MFSGLVNALCFGLIFTVVMKETKNAVEASGSLTKEKIIIIKGLIVWHSRSRQRILTAIICFNSKGFVIVINFKNYIVNYAF